jgi:hypothetical protein
MFDLHSKADPAILTFVNPVSAYHASVAFTAWRAGDGSKYGIYDVVNPLPPIQLNGGINDYQTLINNYHYTSSSTGVWTDQGFKPYVFSGLLRGGLGFVGEDYLVYDNVNTITCKYRVRSILVNALNPNGGTKDIFNTARAIIKQNKKGQGFTRFDAWTYSIQVADRIPLAFGSEEKGFRMYWTPALEDEWL